MYGPVDDDALARARVLASSLWAALAEYAHDVGMPALSSEALAGLARAPPIAIYRGRCAASAEASTGTTSNSARSSQ